MRIMFTLPDLPYDLNALEPSIDSQTMYLHHDKHHASYVNNLNEAIFKATESMTKDKPIRDLPGIEGSSSMEDLKKLLQKLDQIPEEFRMKIRNNGGGHLNHTMFWETMIPTKDYKELEENSLLFKKLMEDLGSWSGFEEEFKAEALGRFGSGWVWLVVDEHKLDIVSTPNQDNPLMEGKTPILGLDVWEHAYYLKYKNMRADYVDAWWNVVNWKKVSENFSKA